MPSLPSQPDPQMNKLIQTKAAPRNWELIFANLPSNLIRLSAIPFKRGRHLTRYAMYNRLSNSLSKTSLKSGSVLSISRSEHLANIIGINVEDLTIANYPEYNILSLSFPDNSFDFVLSDQVLEHVEGDPFRAIGECFRVLKPGGISIHTTCFMNPVHKEPGDFWRFTEDSLRLMSEKYSQTIESGSWGNFMALRLIKRGMRFCQVPESARHPLHKIAVYNDSEWPIVNWIVSKKL